MGCFYLSFDGFLGKHMHKTFAEKQQGKLFALSPPRPPFEGFAPINTKLIICINVSNLFPQVRTI